MRAESSGCERGIIDAVFWGPGMCRAGFGTRGVHLVKLRSRSLAGMRRLNRSRGRYTCASPIETPAKLEGVQQFDSTVWTLGHRYHVQLGADCVHVRPPQHAACCSRNKPGCLI